MFAAVVICGSKDVHIVPVKWIHKFDPLKIKINKVYFCFMSPNISSNPNFEAQLIFKYDATKERLYKVFVQKVYGTYYIFILDDEFLT